MSVRFICLLFSDRTTWMSAFPFCQHFIKNRCYPVLVSHWRDASASRGQSFGRCLQQPPIHWAQRHTIVGMQISKKETPSQPLQPSRRQQLRPKEKSIRTYYETKKHFKTKREKNRDFYPGNRYVPVDPKSHVDVICRRPRESR